jgi:acetyl-CoA acetyltransferase
MYDGFTFLTLSWIEALGLCGPGEAGALLAKSWDADEGRVRIRGRVLLNSHGGSLSEGGSQGSGQIREAVTQLRGSAQERQIDGVSTVYVAIGGFYGHGLVFVRG